VKQTARASRPAGDEPAAVVPLLKERAYATLKQQVITGHYAPGRFLSERGLSQQLGMSKTPIRAALERLEAEGYVAVSARQGIVVREPALREVAEQFELRLALEGYVLRRLAGSISTAQVSRVHENLDAQKAAARRSDLEHAVALDTEFHLLFPELLGNREILRVLGGLREKITWVIWLVTKSDLGRLRPSWAEHEGIAEAVIGGQGELAARRLEAHLEYGRRLLLQRG
jgi:DNA-binding GntR family transcriptional regulator